ncbi:unnamed protein product [Rotaria magnacalcarata]|uniref:Uncharacterized protein n=1 Tax=Rotaria magnacalcarata TaxID=392030 RepID=A0A819KDA0_9BILA|nr:unnamed protein product [Rotaria magnacalcarata]CAF1324789.1 unnamed protein product [Rotaria magnacalcarata]CAF1930534.1 unnamed protein product [Rotaria magnacalcarata]CAF1998152.1 unnamed protein product [Rotaria magnacalcarata]CAF2230699.1 unnamed protein product [Rotaria magnacalcarata]
MPREQVEWFAKQSLHDDNKKTYTRQYCTYCSVVNINKSNNPYGSSFEQEQTWTLGRSISKNNKRYQTSIENIHLTMPSVSTIVKPYSSNSNYDDGKLTLVDRSISLLPPLPPPRQHGLSMHRSNRTNLDAKVNQQQNSKAKSTVRKSQPITNLMRIMHVNGEFIVRI